MSETTQKPRGAHLVGSINLPDAETTFRTVSAHLGPQLRRIPDGEVGDRFYWIQFQKDYFDSTPGLSRVGDIPVLIRDRFDARPLRVDEGVDASTLTFPSLGYADAAIDSYARFSALRAEGVIAPGTRFQVCLPTPAGVVGSFFVASDRAAVEPVYERALFRELGRILEAIPHDDLAIQWDTALEFGLLEGAVIRENRLTAWFDDVLGGVVERAVRQASAVPADVEVGYHLCYGDVEEHHFTEPRDAGMLADVLSGVFAASTRPISWVHLPVPIDRDDDAFFAPLDAVEWPAATEIYLGLLHHEDGTEGAGRRIATARRHVPGFGVATECGFGRGPRERTESLLDLHAAIAAPVER
ncbi:hypothetical protein [Compostimonas suwonensis]|uniref:Methionine synthase II (Cobalamin-independent) n=1 Tax=Compostimonas suwonensis TaxID=1048394 RepID=A0A2M9C4H8_9MICO|nr:hypothetical protein [Compostimonas suwonensis]PJJ65440.1 hypothetical protein CLV54_0473 [Compostimonas suwonensis]